MRFPPAVLDEIRARVPVSRIVARRVSLKRQGREFIGLSPFNKERTPSFTVNDEKGFYHCFSSGEHGDIFAFIMKAEGLSFAEAVEQLAGEAGVALPKLDAVETERQAKRNDLYDVVEAACRYFEAQLGAEAGRGARDYLARRGLDDDAARRFRLGYAPADGRGVLAALAGLGIDADLAVEAGIARRPDDGRAPYGFFRHRLIFPVSDLRDRVVGFGGRLLDGDGPKYINSPDGPLFHKGRLLYGLARARDAVRKGQRLVVAEGYMDVIALVRAGHEGAVAPLGTAFTEDQAEAAWRVTPEPILCFDGDNAGRRAGRACSGTCCFPTCDRTTQRCSHCCRRERTRTTLVREGATAALDASLLQPVPLASVLWDLETGRHNLKAPEGRAGLEAGLTAQAERIADRGVQMHYRREFRQRAADAFPWRTHNGSRAASRGLPRGAPPTQGNAKLLSPEAILLGLALVGPQRFDSVAEDFVALSFDDADLASLHRTVCSKLMASLDLDSARRRDHLAEVVRSSVAQALLTKLRGLGIEAVEEPGDPAQVDAHWLATWTQVERRRIEREHDEAATRYRETGNPADLDRLRALRAQAEGYRRLDDS